MTRELKNIEASIKGRLYNVVKKEKLNFDFLNKQVPFLR